MDAWQDCDDDIIKISSSPIESELYPHEKEVDPDIEQPIRRRSSGSEAQSKWRQKELRDANVTRAEVKVSQEAEMKERQPEAGKRESRHLKNSIRVKQAIVSKLSETIGENVNCFSFGMSWFVLYFDFHLHFPNQLKLII